MFSPYSFRRQPLKMMVFIFIALFGLSLAMYFFFSLFFPNKGAQIGPEDALKQFYAYEQAGDFGSSWELFHPLMKEKLEKQVYIEARARAFLHDQGVNTFEVIIGDLREISSWKMSPSSPALTNAQMAPVTLRYQSYFGDLEMKQDVYVAKDENEAYRILWPYSRP